MLLSAKTRKLPPRSKQSRRVASVTSSHRKVLTRPLRSTYTGFTSLYLTACCRIVRSTIFDAYLFQLTSALGQSFLSALSTEVVLTGRGMKSLFMCILTLSNGRDEWWSSSVQSWNVSLGFVQSGFFKGGQRDVYVAACTLH